MFLCDLSPSSKCFLFLLLFPFFNPTECRIAGHECHNEIIFENFSIRFETVLNYPEYHEIKMSRIANLV